MSKFDDLIQEARDAGVDTDWLERFEQASAGSPLRKEKDQLATQLAEATETATKYRTAALTGVFTAIGVKVKPDALNIPADLDPLDTDKVREWAVNAGIAEPAPPAVPPEQQAAQQRIAAASDGAPPAPPNDARQSVLDAKDADDFWAKAGAGGFTT